MVWGLAQPHIWDTGNTSALAETNTNNNYQPEHGYGLNNRPQISLVWYNITPSSIIIVSVDWGSSDSEGLDF